MAKKTHVNHKHLKHIPEVYALTRAWKAWLFLAVDACTAVVPSSSLLQTALSRLMIATMVGDKSRHNLALGLFDVLSRVR